MDVDNMNMGDVIDIYPYEGVTKKHGTDEVTIPRFPSYALTLCTLSSAVHALDHAYPYMWLLNSTLALVNCACWT
jgi:hypothetical protein